MRKLLVPTLMTLVGLGILLSLGTWQKLRHDWKQGILAEVKAGIDAGAVPYENWKDVAEKGNRTQFIKIHFSGRQIHEGVVYVHTIRKGKLGYLALVPVSVSENKTVFVNLGFISEQSRGSSKLKKDTEFKDQEGFIRLPEQKNSVTPDPDLKKRIWYVVDLKSMKAAAGASIIETGHYIELFKTGTEQTWPLRRNPKEFLASIPDRHLEYAFTWYGLAFALVCVYIAFAWSIIRKG